MRNVRITICFLIVAVLLLAFAGCNSNKSVNEGGTEQTANTETTTVLTTDADDKSVNSTELFTAESDDLEIMTAPITDSFSQNSTESHEENRSETQAETTEETEIQEQSRIELPFVPAQ